MAQRLRRFLAEVRNMLLPSSSTKQAIRLWLRRWGRSIRAGARVVGDVWRKKWFGYFLIAGAAALGGLWVWHVPPAGYAVTAMAGIASVMALRADMGGSEKWFWLFVLFMYVGVEIKSINHDRREQATTFRAIGEGITRAVNQGTEVLQRGQAQFTATMLGLDENIRMITGGDSVCYVSLISYPKTPNVLDVVGVHRGRYPLRDVHGRVVDVAKFNAVIKSNPQATMEDLQRDDISLPIGNLALHSAMPIGHITVLPTDNEKQFNIFFSGLNGFWSETIKIKWVNNVWPNSISVSRTVIAPDGKMKDEQVCEQIDKTYPGGKRTPKIPLCSN